MPYDPYMTNRAIQQFGQNILSTAMTRQQLARQQQQDALAARQAALNEQITLANLGELQRKQQQQQQLQGALSDLFAPQRVAGTGPMAGIAQYQPGQMQIPEPSYQQIRSKLAPLGLQGLQVAEQFKGQQINPFEGLESGYETYLRANMLQPSPESYQAYQENLLAQKRAGAAQTQINVGGAEAQTPFAKKLSESAATQYSNIIDKASTASERRSSIQLQRAVLEEGLDTGAFAPFVNAVAGVAEGMGVDPTRLHLPDPTKGQIFNQATFQSLLNALAAQKGPQTEGDAQRAMKTFATMGNTVEANKFILDYMTALADRQEYMADFLQSRLGDNPPASQFRSALKDFRGWAKRTPLVAKSKNTGIPITYSKYRDSARERGIPENQIDAEWRKFSRGQ